MSKNIDEGYCPARLDEIHCEHWWDGDKCHSCKAPAMSIEQQIEQGMLPMPNGISLNNIIKWAAIFLKEYADVLGSHCSNDFDLSRIIPNKEDQYEFVKAYHQWNDDLKEWEEDGSPVYLMDFSIVAFIGHLLQKD